MILTEQDKVLTATQAMRLTDMNKGYSDDNRLMREIMVGVLHAASTGLTSFTHNQRPVYSKALLEMLARLGYKTKVNRYEPDGGGYVYNDLWLSWAPDEARDG